MTISGNAPVGVLLNRYLLGLDRGGYDDAWFRSLFTADAVVEFPHVRHEGVAGMVAFHRRSLEKYAAVQ